MSPGEPVGDALRIRGFYCPRFLHGWGTRAFIVDVRDKLGDDQIEDLLESVGHPRSGLQSFLCADMPGLLTRHTDVLPHGRFNLTVLRGVLDVTW